MSSSRHGILAAYASADAFLEALRAVRGAGVAAIEAYLPYPLEGVDDLLPGRAWPLPGIMLAAGLAGALAAFALQAYASFDYPVNVGGRPLFSWPSYVPITFELTVLSASFAGLAAFLWFARLPRLDHPVFRDSRFARASQDRFFLCVRRTASGIGEDRLRVLLGRAESIEEVPS